MSKLSPQLFQVVVVAATLALLLSGGPIGPIAPSNGANAYSQIALIAMAIDEYERDHRAQLPRVVRDQTGRPLYSWRVLLLPYLEHYEVYADFRLDEPWDSPHNRDLISSVDCFSYYAEGKFVDGTASVVWIHDAEDVIPDANLKFACVTGGTFYWSQPRDLSLSELRQLLATGNDVYSGDERYFLGIFDSADGHADNNSARHHASSVAVASVLQ